MNNIVLENEVMKPCLKTLKGFLGKDVIVNFQPREERGRPDFRLRLPTQPQVEIVGECKANVLTRAATLHLLFQARRYAAKNEKVILFAKWIPEAVAEELRQAGAYFVDTAGNAYLWNPPHMLIDIRGKRLTAYIGPEPGRLMEVGGLKILHFLLTQPQLIDQPLRVIAEQANVALGTAHKVMHELMLARMLLPGPHGTRRFGDVKNMIDTFVRGYALKLRPHCIIGRYRHRQNHPDAVQAAIQERLRNTQALWALTGGMAAKQLTRHLEPDTVALFVDEIAEQELKKEPMLPDNNGNVILLRLFGPNALGRPEVAGLPPLVRPLLIYAELLNDGGAREAETANLIYERIEQEAPLGQRT
ncbi:MAG: hypothetical protein HY078_01130 [Elusimicrobia bacterium]|nr:hypothetical protein [Elusimicrobiota bacterium]